MTQNKLDTYLDLCTQVYDLSKPKPPEDAYKFYRSYIGETKGLILEPMCGTGRFLLPFISEGFAIDGFDASDYMLTALADKAQELNLKPNVWKGFLQDLNPAVKYDLVFIPAGSFGLIIDLPIAKSSLIAIYESLSNSGTFVFEGETPSSMPTQFDVWEKHEYIRDDGKIIIASFMNLESQSNVASTTCQYELLDKGHIINTEVEHFQVRTYEANQMLELLNSVGFKKIKMVKAFDRIQSPNENDEVIVYECQK
jgi:SAM-dependent methyltransferase